MTTTTINRRDFIKSAAPGIALLSLPGMARGQTTRTRLEWQQFKTTTQYASFLYAVRTMKANTNAASASSWRYWVNVHVNFCPHGMPYFLAWHRGYLYYLEQRMRTVSGNTTLTLPYWDYYRYPRIPSEFTDRATGNPLYVSRVGTNVYNALDLAPFASTVYNFQTGKSNAFEPKFESAPHNPVHNIIGGNMATMESPLDPIFFLHHANVDRLWHAWALPDGKGIPRTANPYSTINSDPYWSGSFTYASGLTMPRYLAYYPGWLSYDYASSSKPTSLPPQSQSSPIIRVQAQRGQILNRPLRGDFATTPGRAIGQNRRAVGGAKDVTLDERSVSALIPVQPADTAALQGIATTAPGAKNAAGPYQSVRLVLDDIKITGAGRNGGFFYNVYLNLPQSGDATASRQRYFVGTLGAFELAGVAHHGSATLVYPATEVLASFDQSALREIAVSLVRVSGENAPRGQVLHIGEMRIELSTDAPFEADAPVGKSSANCYCDK
ncbi:MAG: tyrosinase family protein [Herminiimonas sp.]|nr:tyrosinase family protein [Herminiimonas sp.]